MTSLKTDTDKDVESSRDLTDLEEPLTAQELISQNLELSTKIDKLLDLSIKPDITIHCKDGIKFEIHKCYLLAASKQFWAETCSEVSKSDVISFDYKSQTLLPFLAFIYTGKLAVKDANQACKLFRFAGTYHFDKLKVSSAVKDANQACKLFRFAGTYHFDKLKAKTAEHMVKDLNFTNVCKYYFLGRHYQCPLLRRKAQMFYSSKCAEIDVKCPNWDKDYPKTAKILKRLQKTKITLFVD
uniref:BTB domain-containing protein n=1 Tax=Panagrolaimus sp. JU765 TaxID=591449 RepID=A0AC34RM59_9BILA